MTRANVVGCTLPDARSEGKAEMITSDVGPWGIVPRALIQEMSGDSSAVVVYALLSSYADRKSDDGWSMSRKRIAEEAGIAVSTAEKALRRLVDAGWITKVPVNSPDGTQGWNRYIIHVTRGVVSQYEGGRTERRDPSPPGTTPNQTPQSDPISDGAARKRPRNELWDALEAEMGPAETRTAQSLRGKAVRDLKEVGATPADVHARCAAYRRKYRDLDLTETALLKHWSRLNTPKRNGDYYDPDTGAWMAAETRPVWR